MAYEETNISEYIEVVARYKKSIISVFVATLIITPALAWNMLGYRVDCVLNIGSVEKKPTFSIFQLENVLTKSDSFDKEIREELENKLTPEEMKESANFKVSTINDPTKSTFPLIEISVNGKNKTYVDAFGKNISNKILGEALVKYEDKKQDLIFDIKKELTEVLSENTSLRHKRKEFEAQLNVFRKSQKSSDAEKDSLDANKITLLKSVKIIPSKRESVSADKKVFLEDKKIIDANENTLESEEISLKEKINVALVRKELLKTKKATIELNEASFSEWIKTLEKEELGREEYLSKVRLDINSINEKEKAIENYEETSLYSLIKSYIWSSSLNLDGKVNLQSQEIALMDKIKEIKENILEVKEKKNLLIEKRENLKEDAAEIEDDIAMLKTDIADIRGKFYENNQKRLKSDKSLVEVKKKNLLIDKEESQIKQTIVNLRTKYIETEKKFLEYEEKIANVLTEQAKIKSKEELNQITIEKLKKNIEKLKNDTYFGMFKGVEKPRIIRAMKTPKRPIYKLVTVTLAASFASLLVALFSVFLLNIIFVYKKTESNP